MSRRSRAREIVLQVLYQQDLNPDYPEDVRQMFVNARLNRDVQMIEFAERLIRGIRQHRDELDRQLAKTATNWKLSRMAVTDRNVLRLGAFEILFAETPDPVAVNEAIELAKRYGTNNSFQFVNGVLDRLIKHKNSPDPKTEETDQSESPAPPTPEQTPVAGTTSSSLGAGPNALERLKNKAKKE